MPSESRHSQSVFHPFPPAYDVVKLVRADKPDQQFGRLSKHLFEAGIFSSEQILLCPEDVLCVIGDMGLARARTLHNYAKRIVLPVFGIQNTYEEPDLTMDQPNIEKNNHIATHNAELEENTLGEGSSTWNDHDSDKNCDVADDDNYQSDSSHGDGLNDGEKDYCVSEPFSRGRSLSV